MIRHPPRSTRHDTLVPYTTLVRSLRQRAAPACAAMSMKDKLTQGIAHERFDRDVQSTASQHDGWLRQRGLRTAAARGRSRAVEADPGQLRRCRSAPRSEERRVGKEWFSTVRFRGWPDH